MDSIDAGMDPPAARRRRRLHELCARHKIDAFLTFDFSDVLYLSGFPSEGCFLLAASGGDFLFSPQLLAGHARALLGQDRGLAVVDDRSLLQALAARLKRLKAKRVGYDPEKVTVGLHRALAKITRAQWVPLPQLVLRQRMLKDAEEIAHIARACQITYDSCEAVARQLEAGQSELEVGRALEDSFFRMGSTKVAFETIVAFAENSSFPHHLTGHKHLYKDSVVLTDLGCSVSGYRSDLTRTRFFGKISAKFKRIYAIVQRAQAEGIAAVRAGRTAGQIDAVCRKIIQKSGYGQYFTHSTGHGVGLDIHEPPRLGLGSKERLQAGMVVTVEPGIYLPGEFGVRIEDTLLVEEHGCRVLTRSAQAA